MRMISAWRKHRREGTLGAVLLRALRLPNREIVANHYHGDVAAGYLRERTHEEKWKRENEIMEEFMAEFPEGAAVLDVPFGTGRFVPLYHRRGLRVSGLDISADMLRAAEQALGEEAFSACRTVIGSADALPFEDHAFDVIVSCRFFSLISYAMAQRVLAEFRRVGRKRVLLTIRLRKERTGRGQRMYDAVLQRLGFAPSWKKNMNGRIREKDFLELLRAFNLRATKARIVEEDETTRAMFYACHR